MRRGRCEVPIRRVWVGGDWVRLIGWAALVGCSGRIRGVGGRRDRGGGSARWWIRDRGTCCGSTEAGSVGGAPGAEQAVETRGVADEPYGDAAGAAGHHGGDEDDAVQEAAEPHTQVVKPVLLVVHHHREPGFDVPGQRG